MLIICLPLLFISLILCENLINKGVMLEGIARYSQNITTERGNCNFENGSFRRLAAVGPKIFSDSIACGLCLGAKTSQGEIVAGVVDLCTSCEPNDILLDKESFSTLGDITMGAIKVQWKPQPCRAAGSLRYVFIKGSTSWWFSIGIRNSAAPVKKMELLLDGQWQPVKKEYYNYFTMSLPGPGPYTFRLTSFFDEVMVEETVPLLNGSSYKGKVQFSTKQGSQLPSGFVKDSSTNLIYKEQVLTNDNLKQIETITDDQEFLEKLLKAQDVEQKGIIEASKQMGGSNRVEQTQTLNNNIRPEAENQIEQQNMNQQEEMNDQVEQDNINSKFPLIRQTNTESEMQSINEQDLVNTPIEIQGTNQMNSIPDVINTNDE